MKISFHYGFLAFYIKPHVILNEVKDLITFIYKYRFFALLRMTQKHKCKL